MLNASLGKPGDREGDATFWKHGHGCSPANDCGKRNAVHSKRARLLKRDSLSPFLETTNFLEKKTDCLREVSKEGELSVEKHHHSTHSSTGPDPGCPSETSTAAGEEVISDVHCNLEGTSSNLMSIRLFMPRDLLTTLFLF